MVVFSSYWPISMSCILELHFYYRWSLGGNSIASVQKTPKDHKLLDAAACSAAAASHSGKTIGIAEVHAPWYCFCVENVHNQGEQMAWISGLEVYIKSTSSRAKSYLD